MKNSARFILILLGLIAASSVAVGAQAMRISATVVPLRLDGTVLVRDARRTFARAGLLVVQSARGEISVSVDDEGHFELPFLPPGTYRAEVRAGTTICAVDVLVPRVSSMVTDLGTFVCQGEI